MGYNASSLYIALEDQTCSSLPVTYLSVPKHLIALRGNRRHEANRTPGRFDSQSGQKVLRTASEASTRGHASGEKTGPTPTDVMLDRARGDKETAPQYCRRSAVRAHPPGFHAKEIRLGLAFPASSACLPSDLVAKIASNTNPMHPVFIPLHVSRPGKAGS